MISNRLLPLAAIVLATLFLSSCGGGSSSGSASDTNTNAAAAQGAQTPFGETTADEGASDTAAESTQEITEVDSSGEIFMNAFTDFSCSPGWANRNGGLGRAAYSGSGTCQGPFPGESGVYAVFLQAQAEADGSSPYAVSLNGDNIAEGNFPYANGSLQCGCSTDDCPDRIYNLGAGIHEIDTGDVMGFFGDDVYPCGEHGSYAKWQGMIFVRQ